MEGERGKREEGGKEVKDVRTPKGTEGVVSYSSGSLSAKGSWSRMKSNGVSGLLACAGCGVCDAPGRECPCGTSRSSEPEAAWLGPSGRFQRLSYLRVCVCVGGAVQRTGHAKRVCGVFTTHD